MCTVVSGVSEESRCKQGGTRTQTVAAAAPTGGQYSPPTSRVVCVMLTFSEWPINFVYPPACIINVRVNDYLLSRKNPSGIPPHAPTQPYVASPPLRRARLRPQLTTPPHLSAITSSVDALCLSKSQQSPSSLKLISNNRTLLITRRPHVYKTSE